MSKASVLSVVAGIMLLVVLALDAAATYSGLQANKVQGKARHFGIFGIKCEMEPSREAYTKGLRAAQLVAAAHVVAAVMATVCAFRCSLDACQRICSRLMVAGSFALSCLAWLCGMCLLVQGANRNRGPSKVKCGFDLLTNNYLYWGSISCPAHALFTTLFYCFAGCVPVDPPPSASYMIPWGHPYPGYALA
ncbi:protein DESIGUAL 4-like [Malania oleifera]|uniref:protein DESIGUAL 4-like n=1 Tax=Malania oleifera TaxID=397392 RepID=UPI0025AE57A7|nr:protein DESIGUAL 4-like [Malania oleifera]